MALSVMINLDDLLFAAYNLGVTSDGTEPSLTKAELRAKLLANVPLVGCAEPKIKTAPEEKIKTKAEKKPREIKPKALLFDELLRGWDTYDVHIWATYRELHPKMVLLTPQMVLDHPDLLNAKFRTRVLELLRSQL